jgi:hypothetical protein
MTRVIEFLISLAIVAVLFLLLGVALPSQRHLVKQAETNRKMVIVYDLLNNVHRFRDWSPITAHDPAVKMTISGPDSGVGAMVSYDSQEKQVGSGTWKITASTPVDEVTYAIENDSFGHGKTSTFRLSPAGSGAIKRNVRIEQSYDVDYGWNLIGRYAGLYVSRQVGDDMQLGLGRISNLLTGIPNIDYATPDGGLTNLQVGEAPAQNLLYIASTVARDDAALHTAMNNNMQWIKKVIDANGLVAAGPVEIITTDLGTASYSFDIAVPVRKAGADADADTQPIKVALEGEVKYRNVPATKAISAEYAGNMAGLEPSRDAMRAWGLVRGLAPIDRPIDVYTLGVDKSFSQDGKFQMYWPVK